MIIHGDCQAVMAQYPDNHFTNILTDPPYGLSFMNKAWDHSVPGKEFWVEALRICKPGAIMLAFGGTRTYHRLACAIEDAGWEIRDCLMWIYASGFPKSHNISKAIDNSKGLEREIVGENPRHGGGNSKIIIGDYSPSITLPNSELAKEFDGYGTALKPSYEPIIMAMKPLDGTFAQNAEKWGVAGINIGACRIATTEKLSIGSGNVGYEGGYKNYNPSNQHSGGRWPANTLFDERAAEMLDEQSGITKSSKNKTSDNRYYPGIFCSERGFTGTHTPANSHNDSGGASRFFYCAKASPSERKDNPHPTVKPIRLLEYLLKLITPPKNALVLDPFAGSGSTLVAAKNLGIACEGIEINEEYCEIARKRIESVVSDSQLTFL